VERPHSDTNPDDTLSQQARQESPGKVAGNDQRPVIVKETAAGHDNGPCSRNSEDATWGRPEPSADDAPGMGKSRNRGPIPTAHGHYVDGGIRQDGFDASQDGFVSEVPESLIGKRHNAQALRTHTPVGG
jgi:hypothetical protein